MKRTKKRFSNVIGMIALMLFLSVGFTWNIQASSVNTAMQTKTGLQVYLIPDGSDGAVSGHLWMYVEVLDENGTPYTEDNWSVELTIQHSSGKTYSSAEFEPSSKGMGYVYSTVDLITGSGEMSQAEYNQYSIIVTVKKDEDTVAEESGKVLDYLVKWPELLVSEWKGELELGDGEKSASRSIVFDFDDLQLFSRVFTVTVDDASKKLKVTEDPEEGIWEVSLSDSVTENVTLHLVDECGNTQDYVYAIEVTKSGLPIFLIIILGFFIAALVGIVVVVLLKKRKKEGRAFVTAEKDKIAPEDATIAKMQKDLTDAKKNLDRAKKSFHAQKDEYEEWKKKNQIILETQPADLHRFHISLEVAALDKEYKKLVDAYNKTLPEISTFAANLKAWQKNPAGVINPWDEVIRDFYTLKEKYREKTNELKKKKMELDDHIEALKEKERILKQPLGVALQIIINTETESYIVNTGRDDCGFALGEKKTLNKEFDMTSRTLSEIFENENLDDVRIAASERADCVLLESKNSKLSLKNGELVKSKEIARGKKVDLMYLLSDNSRINIQISTR